MSAENMKYFLYFFDLAYLDRPGLYTFTSQCGLDHLSTAMNPAGVMIFPATVPLAEIGQYEMTRSVTGLLPNRIYRVAVVAVCDAVCLRQLAKTINNPRLLTHCYGTGDDCKAQTYVYSYTSLSTAATADDSEVDDDSVSGGGMSVGTIIGLFILVAFVVVVAGGVLAYFYKATQDTHPGMPSESSHGLVDWVNRYIGPSSDTSSHGAVGGSGNGSNGGGRWSAVLGNIQQGAASLTSAVRNTASAISQRAGGPLASRGEAPSGGKFYCLMSLNECSANVILAIYFVGSSAVQMGNVGWTVPKPAWGSSTTTTSPSKGSKAYQPVRGDFSIEDDEELEVSL